VEGLLKEKWRAGSSLNRLGEELGISGHTVSFWRARWGEREAASPKLRRVEVVKEKAKTPRAARVTMHGPAGTRIEGLNLDEVAALWSKLS
jgi:transposase-like protein